MAVVFNPLQDLTKNDLNIFIKDQNNNLFDPFYISFKIVNTDNIPMFAENTITPRKEDTGWYWADIRIPDGGTGTWIIQWTVQDTSTSPLQLIEQKFAVLVKKQITYTPTIGGIVYYPGQTLAEKDLYIMVKNHLGNLTNPYSIFYEIYQRVNSTEILMSSIHQSPLQLGIGHFYANFQIPSDAIPGEYFIKWIFKDTPDADDHFAVQEFAVVDSATQITSLYTETAQKLIRKLRFVLRDNNPDRNYHFMPPAAEEVVQGFTQKFGYVWEDEELYEYIDIAISDVNNHPPHEDWSINSLSPRLFAMVLCDAGAIALRALATCWIHQEWQGDLSGIGLQIEKSSKYLQVKENFENEFKRQLEEHKTYGVRFIRGLRLPRYGVGVTSALGPYNKVGVQNRRNYISGDRSLFY